MQDRNRIPRAAFGPTDMPLDAARSAFGWLVTGPEPLSVDGREFAGLPDRTVPLDEVRQRLLRRRCPQPVRDAVWAHLVRRSRAEAGASTVGCVGVALPALTGIAAKLTARFAGDPRDIHAAVLAGFLAELPVIDLARPRIMLRLRWAAYRAGHTCLRESLDAPTPSARAFHSAAPPAPAGHPDLVMARAVTAGAITPVEAELIGSTRLEEVSLAEAAARRGTGYEAAKKARQRAEHRLVAFVREHQSEPDDDQLDLDAMTADDSRRTHRVTVEVASGTHRRRVRRRMSPDAPHGGVQVRGRDHPVHSRVPHSPKSGDGSRSQRPRPPAAESAGRTSSRPVETSGRTPRQSTEGPRCA
ncbi:hypothetical protein [Pseudonocardia sp. MH-G8]|uniref:hypothetical protein n=1 Tax=Pseudonocardia sp. MH-G8 TaxID=1854588 RepID=UPI0018EA00F1|nr:hypothetical protein [Pseudonocardia sp. MH-G8]